VFVSSDLRQAIYISTLNLDFSYRINNNYNTSSSIETTIRIIIYEGSTTLGTVEDLYDTSTAGWEEYGFNVLERAQAKYPSIDFSGADEIELIAGVRGNLTHGSILVCVDDFYLGPPQSSTTEAPTKIQWVRTMPMTVWQVFINEDNDFQFIFWYPYKDNNWVRIYDMEDNLVHETDLPINDPNLIVDLPDGFYMVKTFHGLVPLQEFLIGKP